MTKYNILVIEDDPSISKLITMTLGMYDYQYDSKKTGKEALFKIVSQQPDIILLDLGLPDMDGTEIIKKVRAFSDIPIIIVSARNEERAKIEALDLGADDYITKPFSMDELLARLRVSIRRVNQAKYVQQEASRLFTNGRLTIDYLANTVAINQQFIHVTPIEYRLLCLFAKNVDRVLTYHYILREVWGIQDNDASALRVFMRTLRKKIEEDPSHPTLIQTHIGVGYRMVSE
ncbi:DNA-binding response regulator [Vagococcus penaei]|uniref:DNA-binding response regulator n=1 Tax=Vagococcus penaei TaxID=633807 RepID=A0A1Q2D8I6_9ENTE|nr:response regulator transcription factor [Vagococcus penaei]AQP54660.1 DNA-binding response regulator [Vagococcus penaei]RSU05312.1 DNA-binding response regulator [Vagococcus penaei]